MAAALRRSAPLVAFLLAACWTGKPFYSKDELRAPIAPGVYRTVGTDSPTDHGRYRVSIRPDGFTSFDRLDGGDTAIAGFVPLPDSGGRFVAWFEEGGARGDDKETFPYGLIERRGAEYLVSFPMCGDTRAYAEALGAIFRPDPKVPICEFRDRASLEAGLRRAAAEGPLETLRLVPLEEAGND